MKYHTVIVVFSIIADAKSAYPVLVTPIMYPDPKIQSYLLSDFHLNQIFNENFFTLCWISGQQNLNSILNFKFEWFVLS